MKAISAAARAFEEALEELQLPEDSPELQDPATLGRRAALLAAAEAVWTKHLGPLFDMDKVRTLLQVGSRQAVSDLARRRRLLVLDASGGRKLYPAFQFDASGRPYPEIQRILEAFDGAAETTHTIASWFTTPQEELQGKTPAAWMRARREPDTLYESARRTAAKLSR
jgi:hypothetical protein